MFLERSNNSRGVGVAEAVVVGTVPRGKVGWTARGEVIHGLVDHCKDPDVGNHLKIWSKEDTI